MGFYETYAQIRDEIAHLIRIDNRMSSLANNILFGLKQNIGDLDFPCLFILPREIELEDISMPNSQELTMSFDLVIALKDYDLDAGLEESIRLAGAIYDIFMGENRRLNDKGWYVTIESIDPGYARNDDMTILHWCSINIKAHTGYTGR